LSYGKIVEAVHPSHEEVTGKVRRGGDKKNLTGKYTGKEIVKTSFRKEEGGIGKAIWKGSKQKGQSFRIKSPAWCRNKARISWGGKGKGKPKRKKEEHEIWDRGIRGGGPHQGKRIRRVLIYLGGRINLGEPHKKKGSI